MAAALGGLGLLRGRLRLRLAAAAASPPSFSSSSSSSSSCLGPRAAVRGGAAARPAAGRSYGSEAKEEEELRVRYLDDEHKGGHGNRYCLLIKEKNKGLEVSQETYASYASLPQQHEEQNMFLQKKKHVSVCFFPVLLVHTLLLAPCVKFICLCLLTACNTSAPSGCLLHISRRGLLHSSLTYRSHLQQLMMQTFPSGTPVPLPLYVLPLHAS